MDNDLMARRLRPPSEPPPGWTRAAREEIPWDRPSDYDDQTDTASQADSAVAGEPAWDRPSPDGWLEVEPIDDRTPDMLEGYFTAPAEEAVEQAAEPAAVGAAARAATGFDADDADAPVLGDVSRAWAGWDDHSGMDTGRNTPTLASLAPTAPAATAPGVGEPAAGESFVAEPVTSEPFASQPFASEPFADEPLDMEPYVAESSVVEPFAPPAGDHPDAAEADGDQSDTPVSSFLGGDWPDAWPAVDDGSSAPAEAAAFHDASLESAPDGALDAQPGAPFGPTPPPGLFDQLPIALPAPADAPADVPPDATASAWADAPADAAADADEHSETVADADAAAPDTVAAPVAAPDPESAGSTQAGGPPQPPVTYSSTVYASAAPQVAGNTPLVVRIELAIVDGVARIVSPGDTARPFGSTAVDAELTPRHPAFEPRAPRTGDLGATTEDAESAWLDPTADDAAPMADEPVALPDQTPAPWDDSADDTPATGQPQSFAVDESSASSADPAAAEWDDSELTPQSYTEVPPTPGVADAPAFAPSEKARPSEPELRLFAEPVRADAARAERANTAALTASGRPAAGAGGSGRAQPATDLWFLATEPATVTGDEPASAAAKEPSRLLTGALTVGTAIVVVALVLVFFYLMTSLLR